MYLVVRRLKSGEGPDETPHGAWDEGGLGGMEVATRSAGGELDAEHTLEAQGDVGSAVPGVGTELPDAALGMELAAMGGYESVEVGAADLLLALQEPDDAHGEGAAGGAHRVEGVEAGDDVALGVGHAAGVHLAVADLGGEWV